MTIEEITTLIDRYGHHALVYGRTSDADELLEMLAAKNYLLEIIKQYESEAFSIGYKARDAQKEVGKDDKGDIYELKEQE